MSSSVIRAGSTSILVGVIDSGWSARVHDQRVQPGIDLTVSSGDGFRRQSVDDDLVGHGTICSRLILNAAQNATILPLRVFDRRLETSPSRLVQAIRTASDLGVRVLNLSLGTHRRDARDALYLVCAEAVAAGMVIVAASRSSRNYPAGFDCVVSVGCSAGLGPGEHCYFEDMPIECIASGVPPAELGAMGTGVAASWAAPRITGRIAAWMHNMPVATLAQIRGMLAASAVRVNDG